MTRLAVTVLLRLSVGINLNLFAYANFKLALVLAAANLAQVLLGAAWIPMWFFLNLYLQQVLGYGAFEGGAALMAPDVRRSGPRPRGWRSWRWAGC